MEKKLSDALLWNRVVNGEERAFEQLFNKYSPGLMRYAKTLLPYPSDEAEDIITEVFIKMWQQSNAINIQTSIASYLYTSVRNKINDFHRSRLAKPYDLEDALPDEAAPDYLTPEKLLFYKELRLEINKLIDMLPERSRLVYQMNRNDGMTYDEIASALNISVNSVKTHMYRSIKFLKETYSPVSIIS